MSCLFSEESIVVKAIKIGWLMIVKYCFIEIIQGLKENG